MKLLDQMSRQYPGMTENEKRIYNLILDDPKAFSLKSIGEAAEILDISKTTLMRYAKSLGFSGYADFRKKLQAEEVLDLSPAKKIEKLLDTDFPLNWADLLDQETANITSTFEHINRDEFMALVERITKCESVNTIAWGISRHLADMLALRLKMVGKRSASIHRRYSTLLEEVSYLPEDSLLIMFELPPYSRESLDAIKAAKAKGIFVAIVTDKQACPHASLADLTFCCPTDSRFFGNSLIAPLFWVNLLTSQVIYNMKDDVLERLEGQRDILHNKQYYL